MVAGNESHRKGVVGGEAARWRRGSDVPTAGSSHDGLRWLGVLLCNILIFEKNRIL
jgi:hypothetical protein